MPGKATLSIAHMPTRINEKWPKNVGFGQFTPPACPFATRKTRGAGTRFPPVTPRFGATSGTVLPWCAIKLDCNEPFEIRVAAGDPPGARSRPRDGVHANGTPHSVTSPSPVLQKPFREGDLARVLGELRARN